MEGQPQRETIVSRPCFCKITNIRRMDKISREFQVEKVFFWKFFGSSLEVLWKFFGSSLEVLWKFFGSSLEVLIEGRFYKLVSMEGRVSILLGCLHASRNAGNYSGRLLLARDSIRCAPEGQPAHSPGRRFALPWATSRLPLRVGCSKSRKNPARFLTK